MSTNLAFRVLLYANLSTCPPCPQGSVRGPQAGPRIQGYIWVEAIFLRW